MVTVNDHLKLHCLELYQQFHQYGFLCYLHFLHCEPRTRPIPTRSQQLQYTSLSIYVRKYVMSLVAMVDTQRALEEVSILLDPKCEYYGCKGNQDHYQ